MMFGKIKFSDIKNETLEGENTSVDGKTSGGVHQIGDGSLKNFNVRKWGSFQGVHVSPPESGTLDISLNDDGSSIKFYGRNIVGRKLKPSSSCGVYIERTAERIDN